jgi:UDP-N-acetylmuramate dehydrogenase
MSCSPSRGTLPQARLSDWTTLRVGGPAGAFVEVPDVASLSGAIHDAEAENAPVLVLGGGSNVVVADAGFPGTVVRIAMRGVRFEPQVDGVVAHVGAGEDWCALVSHCVTEGLSGTECLSGIPGLAGATPVQNVGAYGQDVSETIISVTAWDRRARSLSRMTAAQCRFSYRDSLFKRNPRYVVTEVAFSLRRSRSSGPVRYEELARRLGIPLGRTAPLGETAQAVIELRRAKGMVLEADDPDSRSVGSFFTNPVLDASGMRELLNLAPDVPRFEGGTGTKVPAAWLVERSGFVRGYRRGGAAISSKHTLALTVLDGGNATDVVALARDVRDGVMQRFGVRLEPEPVLVGLHL